MNEVASQHVMGRQKERIPKMIRSRLHRCLLRNGISRLPASDIRICNPEKLAPVKVAYVHIDSAEL
jgi:hypothetical protein